MPRPRGIPTILLERIEDRTAVALSAKEAAARIALFLRGQRRRRSIDDADWQNLVEDWTIITRVLDEQHDTLKGLRGNPRSLLGE